MRQPEMAFGTGTGIRRLTAPRGASLAFLAALCWLAAVPAPAAALPPAPSTPSPACDAVVGGTCYVNGAFSISSYSAGAHHYRVCRSNDTTGWGGCNVVISSSTGSSFTVAGSDLPSDGYKRAYRFSACDAANNCTDWAASPPAYVRMDSTPPSVPYTSVLNCYVGGADCWVTGDFVASVVPASDSGSGVAVYDVCRSHDTTGWGGCNVWLVASGSLPLVSGIHYVSVSGSHLPSDGYRRAYYVRAKDRVGNWGAFAGPHYVRVDRNAPTVSASNSSTTWFASRTATVSAADATGGAAANSGLAGVRYRWNAALDPSCTSGGSATSSGATLTVPQGDNTLYLCARDQIGRVSQWSGTYRVDASPPTAPGPSTVPCKYTTSTPADCWVTGDFAVTVTAATDGGSGVSEYNICRSNDTTGWGGCDVALAATGVESISGSLSFFVNGSHLPADGYRRAYYVRAKDGLGQWSAWNTPRYVRVDRYTPTVSADNSSTAWFASRTATLSAADSTGGAGANSGLAALRYRWNAGLDSSCASSGTAASSGTTLTVPEGDNILHLCARDHTGRIATWTGTYRVESAAPILDSLTVSSSSWSIGDGSTYQITARASDSGTGVRELRALINLYGGNSANPRGNFSWRDQTLGYLWTADQVACAGGGYASKRPDAFNPEAVTLVGCSTSKSGGQRTVTFTLRPEASFGHFGPINDVAFWARDFVLNAAGWKNYDLNFSSGQPFVLSFEPEEGLYLDTRGVEPGEAGRSSDTFKVRLTRNDASSDPVSLSVAGLPAGVTAQHPPTISPNQTATITLSAALGAPDGTHRFEIIGTDSDGSPSPLPGNVVVADVPNFTSVTPETIPAGQTTTVTIRGTDLRNVEIDVVTQTPRAEEPERVLPLVTVLSENVGGTELMVSVDATAPGVEGYFGLVVTNPAGSNAAPVRVIPNRPVIDFFSPYRPSESDLYVFAAVGANLAGATLTATDPNIQFYEVETADDYILSFMNVLPGADPSVEVMVSTGSGSVALPMEVMTTPDARITGNVVVGSSVTDPGILAQELAPFETFPGIHPPHDPRRPRYFRFKCGGRSHSRDQRLGVKIDITDYIGRKGQALLAVLQQLPLGFSLPLSVRIVDISLHVEASIVFICQISDDPLPGLTLDIDLCISASVRTEIIGLGSLVCRAAACDDGASASCEGDGLLSELFSFSTSTASSCTIPTDQPESNQGERLVNVEQVSCCTDTVSFEATGKDSLGDPFEESWTAPTGPDEEECSPPEEHEVEYVAVGWIDERPVEALEQDLRDEANLLLVSRLRVDPLRCVATMALIGGGLKHLTTFPLPFTNTDREYVNAFVFSRGGDPPPPTTFPSDLERVAYQNARAFRIMSRLKVRYGGGDVEILETPEAVRGLTVEPCTGLRLVPAQFHPDNGAHGVLGGGSAYLLSEARVHLEGQVLDSMLNGEPGEIPGTTTPWIWTVLQVDSAGNLDIDDRSIFNTFNIYRNGQAIHRFPQSHIECFIAQDSSYQRQESEIPATTHVDCTGY